MKIKKIIKKLLPLSAVDFLKKINKTYDLFYAYFYDLKKFYQYSFTFKIKQEKQLEAVIIKHYHIIEKGLTMPKRRLGFGQDMVITLSNDCLLFLYNYNFLSKQVIHAIGVLKEYKKLHEEHNYILSNDVNIKLTELIKSVDKYSIGHCTQLKFRKNEYFQYTNSSFDVFSNSRKSVRNYIIDPVPEEQLKSALALAMNTPSACNRQATRLHVFTDKNKIQEILAFQNGNRGFGHLASTLIIVSVDLSAFSDAMERNQAFIDGGMFAMNLLYCLHYQNIASCILNCSNTPKKDRQIQKICNISRSNVFIAMITCGLPPDEFMVAKSLRNDLNDICIMN